MGRAIHAAESGVVTKVEYRTTGYGLKVVVDHGGRPDHPLRPLQRDLCIGGAAG